MTTLSPIVFFAYNRPEHTRKSLESLAECEKAAESELYIFCDGPRTSDDRDQVEKVREVVESRQWCKKVHITKRDKNWGLANSIIQGVTEIINQAGRIIVLEDDLVLSPHFLNYMNDALEYYKNTPEVMHISGYMFPVKGNLPETFFYRATSCSGWATWKRAWEKFEPDSKKLITRINTSRLRKEFNINGSMHYYRMLREQDQGKIDSWAIRWYASVFLNHGLCLHPGKSYVNNIGHDGSGVHCASMDVFDVELNEIKMSHFTMDLQEEDIVTKKMEEFYLALQKALKKPLHLRIRDKLIRTIRAISS
jgi:hypothetical protein